MAMDDKDKLQELLEARAQADQELEKLRTPMTILFSDIKGSTAYAEKKGDVEYMSMINRHNSMLFPVIEAEGGRVVKTIGDAILAQFDDPVSAVKAAAGMQRALENDREGREEIDQIRIRIGLHHGLGLIKDNDVYGDVVNAASRVEHLAEPEQILITGSLLDAAQSAGFQCAKMGRAEIRGKDEPIDLYAVAWSESATQQLIEEIQVRYEKRFKEIKRQHEQLEEDFEDARDQWRGERRNLNAEIEQLEGAVERARQTAKQQISDDLQSEIRFQLEEASRNRQQLEQDLLNKEQKFEAERTRLKAQISGMQASLVDALARTNNPTRAAMALREQVEARVAELKHEWQMQWEGERKRYAAQIERLQKAGGPDFKKDAARRAVLEKLGKLPASPKAKTAEQLEHEYQDAKIQWSTEREQLNLMVKKLETQLQRSHDTIRSEIYQELQAQYEPKLNEANRERNQLEQEIQTISGELVSERHRWSARIEQLEKAIPEAQEAARKQALAELREQLEENAEEANRQRLRLERKQQELVEDAEAERRRAQKQIAALEEQLKEAKETAYKAQKSSSRSSSSE